MINGRSKWWLAVAALLALLIVVNLLAGFKLAESRAAALDAQSNLDDCVLLADSIALLRQQEAVAGAVDLSTEILNGSVLELVSRAGIPESQLSQIHRLPPAAVEGFDYRREEVVLHLSAVTLQQVVQLMLESSTSGLGVTPTALRLNVSSGAKQSAPGPEQWNAELVLTHLVYAATSR